MPHLILTGSKGNTPLRFELREGTQVVGRNSECEIAILDTAVSRKHAEIEVSPKDEVLVRDLGSTNGSYYNGKRFEGEIIIKPGDRLRFGHVNLTLLKGGTSIISRQLAPEGSVPATLTTSIQELRSQPAQSESEKMLSAIAEAGQMLSQRIELEQLYEEIVSLLSRFIKASRILILSSMNKEGDSEILASRLMGSAADEPLRLSRHMLSEIIEKKQSILTKDASLDQKFSAHESIIQAGVIAAMGAPLFDNEKVLGAVYVDSKIPGVEYSEDNLMLLTLLANMIAVKITNSRLEVAEREAERYKEEIAMAERIQRNLLPQDTFQPDGYHIFTHMTPCTEVGGDLFDVRQRTDGRVWISLGDVTGHGMGAALLMSNVMAGLQILEDALDEPLELVQRLENHLLQHVEVGQFVTMFVGILDPATGQLVYCNAGHNPPLILKGKQRTELPAGGMAVAMLPGQSRTPSEIVLQPGETLLVFSDGIPETHDNEKLQYDEVRMEDCLDELGSLPGPEIGKYLLKDVDGFRKNAEVEDDLTLVVVHRH